MNDAATFPEPAAINTAAATRTAETTGITAEELLAEYVADHRARHGADPAPEWLEYLEQSAADPAHQLAHVTTACPEWCDRQHDTGAGYVVHGGPQLIDRPATPTSPAWSASLQALEYVDRPGELRVSVYAFSDGAGQPGPAWDFELPAECLRWLAAVADNVAELAGV